MTDAAAPPDVPPGAVSDPALAALLNQFTGIQRLKTDVFRDRVRHAPELEARLAAARGAGPAAVATIAAELLAAPDPAPAALIDLLLSQRAVRDWNAMIALVARLPPALRDSTLVQEQFGLALNRAGRDDESERVLNAVLARCGPSSETCSLLGRVHKNRFERAQRAGDAATAARCLQHAADAYRQGFEADPSDAFPGINALTLMTLQQPPDPRRTALRPAVQAALETRLRGATPDGAGGSGGPDYWDHATRIELAVLARDEAGARAALADALAAVREAWEPESTARNLALIRAAREARADAPAWAREVEAALARRGMQTGTAVVATDKPGNPGARCGPTRR
ncbi:MAG: TRAFs-binding domain-containing protein [Rubrivivax sp.]